MQSKFEQPDDPLITSLQRAEQLKPRDPSAIDTGRCLDLVTPTDHLDPHTPDIVNMARDHANGSSRSSGDLQIPYVLR